MIFFIFYFLFLERGGGWGGGGNESNESVDMFCMERTLFPSCFEMAGVWI